MILLPEQIHLDGWVRCRAAFHAVINISRRSLGGSKTPLRLKAAAAAAATSTAQYVRPSRTRQ